MAFLFNFELVVIATATQLARNIVFIMIEALALADAVFLMFFFHKPSLITLILFRISGSMYIWEGLLIERLPFDTDI